MHAITALACMQRGKSVYVEKPLTRTPWEARLLFDAAAKYKVATQSGNQGYANENHRVAAEILWSGEIGAVKEVHVSTITPVRAFWPQGLQELPPEEKIPDNLDWDLWLGGATMRPYRSQIVPFQWRGYFDFGTGPLGDWGVHAMGPLNLALRLALPISVEVVKQEGKSQWTYPNDAKASRVVSYWEIHCIDDRYKRYLYNGACDWVSESKSVQLPGGEIRPERLCASGQIQAVRT